MAIAAGLKVAWISGRTSGATVLRSGARRPRPQAGVKDKGAAARDYLSRWKLEPEERPAPAATTSRIFRSSTPAASEACPADAVSRCASGPT